MKNLVGSCPTIRLLDSLCRDEKIRGRRKTYPYEFVAQLSERM